MKQPSPAATNPYASTRSAYYALVVLTVVFGCNALDRQLLAILQEPIKAELGLSDSQLGLLTGFAFAVFYVSAGIPIARWADHANRRNIVALALTLWSFMTAISGLTQNYVQLVLARIGVGVGEAGGSPPSHSIISDIFPPGKRATALGFFTSGGSFGLLFGFLLGGWLNEFFGWRVAFFVLGVPGILLAIVVRFTLAEPIRGMSEQRTVSDESVSTWQVFQLLWSRRTFRHLAAAAALTAFASYSVNNWLASFFIRNHGMSTGELGTWLALVLGVGSGAGVFFGAMLADHLARRDKRWYAWLPALAGVISMPFAAAIYLADNPYVALALAAVPGVLLSAYVGNTLAVTHGLVGLRMRALSSAVLFFVLNIVGLGAGPWCVGMLSDYLTPALGSAALGWAMLLLLPPAILWSSVHFYLAAGTLRQDLEAAPA